MGISEIEKEVYEVIADKTLNFWCKVTYEDSVFVLDSSVYISTSNMRKFLYIKNSWYICNVNELQVIWHPIWYWIATHWLESKYELLQDLDISDLTLAWLWYNKKENVEHPDNIEAMKFLSNLISKEKNSEIYKEKK